jgi:uncharacterized repeat protein (TIGR01451 family)
VRTWRLAAVSLALGTLLPTSIRAQLQSAPVDPIIPGLHDTGVDDEDKKLKAGDPDRHYSVTGPLNGTPTVIGPNDIPKDWISRQDTSQWISIADDTFAPEGAYRYAMEIDLAGFDASSVAIAGMWASDNSGAVIRLNGQDTGNVNDIGPGEYTPFTLDRGFRPGRNTIEFVVPNLGSGATRGSGGADEGALATGLRVQLTSVTAVKGKLDLAISKSHTGDFTPGGSGSYSLVVRNAGDSSSTATVTVSDTLPAGLTPTAAAGSGWNCTVTGQDVRCVRDDTLNPGQSYPAITIDVAVAATATSVTNTARVSTAGDTNAANDTASDPTTIVPATIDLTITKTHSGQFQQGRNETYQVAVRNVGAAPSVGSITVRDTLPGGLTPVSATGDQWSCQIAGQLVTCTRTDPLAAGASTPPIALTVAVAATATTVTNTASVEGGGDGNAANNTASDLTVVGTAFRDLTIAKSHPGGDFVGGQTARTFTIEVSNVGDTATNAAVTVRDSMPPGLTATAAVGAGWTCSIGSGAAVECTRPDSLAAGAAYPALTITVNVATDASDLVNTATVEGGGDTVSTNNSAQDAVKIVPPGPTPVPDLTMTKSHPGNATQGQIGLVFTITARNRGDVTTNGSVTVTDPFPAGLSPTDARGVGWTCRIAGSQVTCDRSDPLAAGAEYPVITVTADVAANASSTENVATVAGGGDGNSANNTARDPVTIGSAPVNPPDVTIAKAHTGVLQPGQRHQFQIDVRNIGSGATSGTVTVTDTVPAGLAPASASGAGWTCSLSGQTITCSRGDVLSAGAAYPTIAASVAVLESATSSVNVATVSGGGDSEPGNNTASDSYTVGGRPDLTISKAHAGNFVQGQAGAIYTITIRNAGGTASQGAVTMTDVVPSGLTARAAAGGGWSCSIASPSVTCTRTDALTAGVTWPTIELTVDVSPDALDLVNTAIVSGGGDGVPGNNTATDPTTVTRGPQLMITKRHPTPVTQGQDVLPFTVTVGNNGGASTVGLVTITDTLPEGLTPVSTATSGWDCAVAGQTVTCSRSDALRPGAEFPAITLNASVSGNAASVVNVATVTGGGDTTPQDNVASDPVAISAPGVPNLTVDKRHAGSFQQGQLGALFSIVVSNAGDQPSSGGMTVADALPGPLKPTAAAGDGWSCAINGQTMACARSDALAAGRSWPAITLTVDVASDAPETVVNTAEVSGGGDDTPADNRDTDEVAIGSNLVGAADLTIDKSHADPFAVGQPDATYTIQVRNVGLAASAGEVVVVDQLPAGFEPAAVSGAGWASTITGQIVTSRRADSLLPGAAFPPIVIRVNVLSGATGGVNRVSVSGGGDLNPANNTDEDGTSIGSPPDLALTLVSTSSPIAGGDIEYTASVQNVGSGSSFGPVLVVSEWSDSLTPVAGIGSGWTCTIEGILFRCRTSLTAAPLERLPPLRFRVALSTNPAPEVVISGQVQTAGDSNPDNDRDELRSATVPATAQLQIVQTAVPAVVEVGGGVEFAVTVTNIGPSRVTNALVSDTVPRGFEPQVSTIINRSSLRRSGNLARSAVTPQITERGVAWRLGELEPGERVILALRAIAGAEARDGLHEASASVAAVGPGGFAVTAGPAPAEVRVVSTTFSMQQVVVGRVYEDVDGDGAFGAGDRGIADARVIASTGHAALADPNGLYSLPSLGSGSIAISLDPGTIAGALTLAADGPGGGSWSRLLRTPVGGGALLRQDFRLVANAVPRGAEAQAAVRAAPSPPPEQPLDPALPLSRSDRVWPDDRLDVTGGATPPLPPRREYQARQGPAMMIGLGEIAIGNAAPEFELFAKDGDDAWGYASLFYQGAIGSPENRFTMSYDSRRHINQTTGVERLFETDRNDVRYMVMGDTSISEELAPSNANLFARLERGRSYVMFGDLIGDLPESNDGAGRLSSYSRHLTGVEGRVGGTNFVSVRGAQPNTAFARDLFTGSNEGAITLSRRSVVPGTETVALEVRDRRAPERILSRRVLARNVDYRLESVPGVILLLVDSGSLDGNLNLVQVVVTYEYQAAGIENMVAAARASGTIGALTIGGSAFTEEPDRGQRFSVAGVDARLRLPRSGELKIEVPYSDGVPDGRTSFENVVGAAPLDADGFAVTASLDQPIASQTALRASYVDVDNGFTNPFAGTTTPGARYGRAELEVDPAPSTRLLFGYTNERNETSRVDNGRHTGSANWNQKLPRGFSFGLGYDARRLEDHVAGDEITSGLITAEGRLEVRRFEAMARREENVGDADDPTYPTQTVLGARLAVSDDTSVVYTHRLSDAPIKPIGDLTGFSALNTTSEFTVGLESRLRDAARLTSRFQVQDGISGPDAFAVIGGQNRFELGHGLSADFGVEHGQAVEGETPDFTTGRLGFAWLQPDVFKATARYEARDQNGYSGSIEAGAAGRILGGVTGLVRGLWLNGNLLNAEGRRVQAGLAVRPVGSDAAGLLLSYQRTDLARNQLFVVPTRIADRHSSLSTDGYWRPISWLELYGKGAWQEITLPLTGQRTNTYLGQGRLQVALNRWIDMAVEQRWLHQRDTDTTRNTAAMEVGVWPIADLRLGVGFNFRDTTDPFGRDRQGRSQGVYMTISSKLAHLFDLLGSTPSPASAPR